MKSEENREQRNDASDVTERKRRRGVTTVEYAVGRRMI